MSEKMLVTQALDERDLLVKKIGDRILKIKAVDTKKRNEDRTAGERLSVDDFGQNAQAAYQQIMDLIDRYQRVEAAIVASNAATWIETSYGRFTVAGAIALRSRLKARALPGQDGTNFEHRLQKELMRQHDAAVQDADAKNRGIEAQAETMRVSILGKDTKVRDDKPLEVVDAFIRENTTEVIDPLDSVKRAQELQERINTLLTELNTQIKVSNATTMVEF